MENKVIIVTRHEATLQWLAEQGITGNIIDRVTDASQIAGKVVIGNLPPYLMARAELVKTVSFENLPKDKRGFELTLNEMHEFGAYLETFAVFTGYMTKLVEDFGKETVTKYADYGINQA